MTGTPATTLPLDARTRQLIGVAVLCVIIGFSVLPYLMLDRLQLYMLIIPAACAGVAVALYTISRPLYVGFSLWMWFLTPFIRRLLDYGFGQYTSSNLVMMAPYLVGGIGILGLWSALTTEERGVRQAFTLAVVALIYAAAVGLVINGFSRMTEFFLAWLIPIVTAALVLVDWRQYPRYREVLVRTLTLGMGVLGLYGIYQFFVLPPWDRVWIEGADMMSVGQAEAMQFRVFGTLNSPNPFGMTMTAGLLGLFAVSMKEGWLLGILARASAVPAVVSLLLTQTRAAWGAYVVGVLYILIQTRSRSRWTLVLYLVLAAVAATPIILLGGAEMEVTSRMESLTDLSDDTSMEARTELYAQAPAYILTNPLGLGLGNLYQVDSGLLILMMSLGWGGSLLYGLGLGLLYWWAWWAARESGRIRDRFIVVAAAISVALLAGSLFDDSFSGVSAFYLWGFLALALAGVRYHRAVEAGLIQPDPASVAHV